jgi:hypothetical protein
MDRAIPVASGVSHQLIALSGSSIAVDQPAWLTVRGQTAAPGTLILRQEIILIYIMPLRRNRRNVRHSAQVMVVADIFPRTFAAAGKLALDNHWLRRQPNDGDQHGR